VAKGYEEARAAAQAYLDTLVRQQQRDISLFGAGAEARSRDAARSQIADRYDEERRRILAEREALRIQQGPTGLRKDQEEQFRTLLDINSEFRTKALDGWDDYYARLREMQGDWAYGASEAFANYAEASRNTAAQSQRVFENAARSMEDAIVTFAQTGKINFSQLASSIIADMLRVEAQRATSSIFSSVLGAIGSFLGSTSLTAAAASNMGGNSLDNFLKLSNNFAGRAIGGPVSAGRVYEINETGRPEVATFGGRDYLLTGGQGGTVRPASDAGASTPVIVNIGQGVTRNEVAALIPTIVKQVRAAVQRDQRRESAFGRV
jgi:lambda family phage tail tape measure protein